jgi:relA/spoT family protein
MYTPSPSTKSIIPNLSDELYHVALHLMEQYYPAKATSEIKLPLVPHLLETAKIISTLELRDTSILATLLAYVPFYHPEHWKDKLASHIDDEVISLIYGFNQIQELTNFIKDAAFATAQERIKQTESMRKMLLAMVNDIRIVFIQLAMVTHNMRQLSKAPCDFDQSAYAKKTLDIFAPLANRLGIWQLKWELEDFGFQYSQPKEYKKIAQLLNEKRVERLEYLKEFTETLKNELKKTGIECEVSGRPKHIYSIYRKMQKKHLNFEELYDIRAVRIMVQTVSQCYHTLGVVHSLWRPISSEFDDYIFNPKPNDYQSLHTVIVGPDNKSVEVQIRTFEMHQFAEFGMAAHWKYKEGGKSDSIYEQKIAWLRQLLDWRENVATLDKEDLTYAFQTELFKDTIYVLTPRGKVISLPVGSTPIDFAYALHTDVGHQCRGAKINGSIVPLSTPLENGQRIEIITSKEGNPSVNWLHEGWVKSPKAIAKIRAFIRKKSVESIKEIGKNYLEKALHKIDKRPSLNTIAAQLHFKDVSELYLALGHGEIRSKHIKQAIQELIAVSQERTNQLSKDSFIKESRAKTIGNKGILINGESDILSTLAKCCKPAPPDPIIGFVTKGRGISIHRQSCPNFLKLAENFPERILSAQWGELAEEQAIFSIDIQILAEDREGLLRDITEVLARAKIRATSIQSQLIGTSVKIKFTLEVKTICELTPMLSQLGNIPGVFELYRL